jgi:hypothetical protein
MQETKPLSLTRVRTLDRPALSQLLYQRRYPSHIIYCTGATKCDGLHCVIIFEMWSYKGPNIFSSDTSNVITSSLLVFLVSREIRFQAHARLRVKKVKQSHYRPRQALSVPGGWGSQISRQSAHENGMVVSHPHRPPLPPGNIPGTHFC